ncbi:MAG: carboxypeptidase-like regulatory domain-containing protein [Haliscomenobacteraceae bacterium CHB4]|nr:carboxypeptidase-like regulatory domain-containing protein [Haliscomenobacteraceae bacterium CHB4]
MKTATIKTLAFCSILTCYLLPLHSQTTLRGRLLDAESGAPLGYVSVGILGSSAGTVAGPDGRFELDVPADAPDSVVFSCIGYERRATTRRDLATANGADIFLQPAFLPLREVVISPSEDAVTSVMGMEKTGTAMAVNFAINDRIHQNLGSEIGRRFKIKKVAQLEKFRFFVSGNNFDTVRFRINVYALDGDEPGGNLLKDNIIVTLPGRKKGWVEVDLLPYDVRVDGPVVVAVEWVYASGRGNHLSLPIAMPRPGSKHFYKFGSQNRWKVFGMMSAAMLLQIRQ